MRIWAIVSTAGTAVVGGALTGQSEAVAGKQQSHHKSNLCLCKEAPRAPAAQNAIKSELQGTSHVAVNMWNYLWHSNKKSKLVTQLPFFTPHY